MFVYRLQCDACGYASPCFSGSKDLYDDGHDLVFLVYDTREVVVRQVAEHQLHELGIDLDSGDAANTIQSLFAQPNEIYAHLQVGGMGEIATNLVCPSCRKGMLSKSNCGLT